MRLFFVGLMLGLMGSMCKPLYPLSRFSAPKHVNQSFPYLNTKAPKGGGIRFAQVGSFDSLNPFGVMGVVAEGMMNLYYEPLMVRAQDESFSIYPYVAERADLARDFSQIIFHLNEKARFHNGVHITSQDVKTTLEKLKEEGLPRFKSYFKHIKNIEIISEKSIKITFLPMEDGSFNREIPMMVALTRIMPHKELQSQSLFQGLQNPITGSGPYTIQNVDWGRSITYKRVVDHWAKDLPATRGLYNFDSIKISYYRNTQSMFQAFLAGETDIHFETDPKIWKISYQSPLVDSQKITFLEREHKRQVPVRTIIMNLQKDYFKDDRVREALYLAFDFDTLNTMLFDGKLKRPHSLFQNTNLAHTFPLSQKEEAFLKKMAPTCLTSKTSLVMGCAQQTKTHAENLVKATLLLKEAGYVFDAKKNVLLTPQKVPFQLSFHIKDQRFEKIAAHFKRSLLRLGIQLNITLCDSVQYEDAVTERKFDFIIHTWANTKSPGNEQAYYFSPEMAKKKGSSNYIGIEDSVAESLAKSVANVSTEEDLELTTHCLDFYIMNRLFQIPLTYDNIDRWAFRSDKVAFPQPLDVPIDIMTMGWSVAKS